jgi:arginyl-tRNA synthetase
MFLLPDIVYISYRFVTSKLRNMINIVGYEHMLLCGQYYTTTRIVTHCQKTIYVMWWKECKIYRRIELQILKKTNPLRATKTALSKKNRKLF